MSASGRSWRVSYAFTKEAKPTDKEFETAWTLMAEMAKFTGNGRNEFLLFCDEVPAAADFLQKPARPSEVFMTTRR
jgi:hypothetical protein